MKRIVAMILLAAFSAAPSLKWLCELTCGAEHPVAVAQDCHHPDEAAQAVLRGHDCSDHASSVALVTTRGQAKSESFVPPRGAWASVLATLPGAGVIDSTSADSSPPPYSFRVPLRI